MSDVINILSPLPFKRSHPLQGCIRFGVMGFGWGGMVDHPCDPAICLEFDLFFESLSLFADSQFLPTVCPSWFCPLNAGSLSVQASTSNDRRHLVPRHLAMVKNSTLKRPAAAAAASKWTPEGSKET